jgi:hypothetical protein
MQLFAGDDTARPLREHEQHLHDFGVELLATAGADDFAGCRVQRENPQTLMVHARTRWLGDCSRAIVRRCRRISAEYQHSIMGSEARIAHRVAGESSISGRTKNDPYAFEY